MAKRTRKGPTSDPLTRLRAACLTLPGATEVSAWGTSTFRCGRIFAMYAQPSDQRHSGGRPGVWLKVHSGVAALMISARPDRFYYPPYVGPSGWVGVWLDRRPSWTEVAELVEDSWRLVAPKAALERQVKGGRRKVEGTAMRKGAAVRKGARTPKKPTRK